LTEPTDPLPFCGRTGIMATRFTEFIAELQREAKAEGPEAVVEFTSLRRRFRLARRAPTPAKSEAGRRGRRPSRAST